MTTLIEAEEIAVAMYVDERCLYCDHKFGSVKDIQTRNVIVAAKNPTRFACGKCYKAHAQ